MKDKNKLIVFEGIDGVGKTTIAHELKKVLNKRGIPVILYEEYEAKHPNFNSLKPLIKKISVSGSHLFYLSSAVYKSQVIKELLKKYWVICDRYFYSSNANHIARGSKLKIKLDDDLLRPDYGFLLTIDERLRKERVKQKQHITKSDLIPKTIDSFPYKMETLLKRMDLIKIDNSSSVKETIKKISNSIFKENDY